MSSLVRKMRHPWTLGAWCAVALSVALGAALSWRTVGYHAGTDLASLSLALLIALGLACGLAELVWRLRQLAAVERELDALPEAAPAEPSVASASAPLRALLQAPAGQLPAALDGARVTPYLAGLLVVLGLSGSLLGLFESLRGAREALGAGGDFQALLTGLVQPLARSLGSAAAGLGASALLGLCSVLVRRVETEVVRRARDYASVALEPSTPEQDAQHALQMLVEQARALPDAATALSDVAERLGTLGQRWEQSHERSALQMRQLLQEAIAHSTEQLGQALGQRSAELGEVARRIEERDTAQQARLEAALTGLDRLLQAAGESLEAQRTQLEELFETTGTRMDQLATVAAHGAADTLEALRSQSVELTERFAAQLDTLRETQHQASHAAGEDLAQQATRIADSMSEQAARIADSMTEQAARITDNMSEQATRMTDTVAQAGGSLGEVSEVLRATGVELSAVAEMFASSVERQQDAARSWLETLGALEGAIEHSGRASAADALGEQLASTQEVFARQLQFQRELFDQLKALRDGVESPSVGGGEESHVHA